VLGRSATISSLCGHAVELDDGSRLVATIHPWFLLRMEPADAPEARRQVVADLVLARQLIETG
jgi:DNA polymerase